MKHALGRRMIRVLVPAGALLALAARDRLRDGSRHGRRDPQLLQPVARYLAPDRCAQGPPGASDIPSYQVVAAAGDNTTSISQATAHCPDGTTAVGGGAEIAGGVGAAVLFNSKPIPNGNGGYDRQAVGVNPGLDVDLVLHVNAFAICATAG